MLRKHTFRVSHCDSSNNIVKLTSQFLIHSFLETQCDKSLNTLKVFFEKEKLSGEKDSNYPTKVP